MKKIIISTCVLILMPTIFLICYFFDDKDFCLTTGQCKEGLKINTEYGLIKINKENCLKQNGQWDDKDRYCIFKSPF